MKIKIEVTQEIINKSKRLLTGVLNSLARNCPLALAIQKAIGNEDLRVSYKSWGTLHERDFFGILPVEAQSKTF